LGLQAIAENMTKNGENICEQIVMLQVYLLAATLGGERALFDS